MKNAYKVINIFKDDDETLDVVIKNYITNIFNEDSDIYNIEEIIKEDDYDSK